MSSIFTFFGSAALVVTILLLLFLGFETLTTQNAIETAAQVGAHVSALTDGNTVQIQQAVLSTLQQNGLAETYNGQNLVTVTNNLVASGSVISITVQYTMPTMITDLGDLVGDPHSMPGAFTLQATESYTNDTFFGG